MRAESLLYRELSDIRSREHFDASAVITPQSFESLIAEYRLHEDVECQVLRKNAACAMRHRHGYIGRTKDGLEVLIGANCAQNHFKASSNFLREKRRIASEQTIADCLNRLTVLTTARPSIFERLKEALDIAQATRQAINKVATSLPPGIARALRQRARSMQTTVSIDALYIRKDKKGDIERQWLSERLGAISGLEIFGLHAFFKAHEQLTHALALSSQLRISSESGERNLQAWVRELEDADSGISTIHRYSSQLGDFCRPDNYRLLCFLSRDLDERAALATMYLSTESNNDSVRNPRLLIKEFDKNLRLQLGCSDIRAS